MSGRSQVTITLGRSGQVVKRGRESGDYEELGTSGSDKGSLKDRLGNGSKSSWHKRQRRGSPDYRCDIEQQDIPNCQVARDDLRFKLLRKNLSRRFKAAPMEGNERDLREKLSRSNKGSRFDAQDRIQKSEPYKYGKQLLPARSADDLLHLDSQRKSYTGWNIDGLRNRSPDRLLGISRTLSPPQRPGDLHHMQMIRSTDTSRPVSAMANTVEDSSRMSHFITNPRGPGESLKPVMHIPPPNSTLAKNLLAMQVEESLTVLKLLNSLGLGKYASHFQEEEVDMTALKQMSDHDLKELGIPMGPRKKILLAIASRSKGVL